MKYIFWKNDFSTKWHNQKYFKFIHINVGCFATIKTSQTSIHIMKFFYILSRIISNAKWTDFWLQLSHNHAPLIFVFQVLRLRLCKTITKFGKSISKNVCCSWEFPKHWKLNNEIIFDFIIYLILAIWYDADFQVSWRHENLNQVIIKPNI